jgi:DNA polymerase-3 subunit delta
VAAASTLPFFGHKSLIVVHGISDFSKGDTEVINAYLTKQTPAATFLLTDTTTHRYPIPSHPAIPKGKARVIDVSSPPPWDWEWEFGKWVNFFLSREKKRISPGALESLRDNVGNNITTLAMEIEKLVCLAGNEKEINETHTKALLGRSRSETEFALADAVASGDSTKALTVFSDLFREGGKIPRMIALIRLQLEKVWLAKEMLQAGQSSEDVGAELKIPRKRVGEFIETVNRFRVGDLRRALRLILNAELRARTEKVEDRTIAEMLLLALCRR